MFRILNPWIIYVSYIYQSIPLNIQFPNNKSLKSAVAVIGIVVVDVAIVIHVKRIGRIIIKDYPIYLSIILDTFILSYLKVFW